MTVPHSCLSKAWHHGTIWTKHIFQGSPLNYGWHPLGKPMEKNVQKPIDWYFPWEGCRILFVTEKIMGWGEIKQLGRLFWSRNRQCKELSNSFWEAFWKTLKAVAEKLTSMPFVDAYLSVHMAYVFAILTNARLSDDEAILSRMSYLPWAQAVSLVRLTVQVR